MKLPQFLSNKFLFLFSSVYTFFSLFLYNTDTHSNLGLTCCYSFSNRLWLVHFQRLSLFFHLIHHFFSLLACSFFLAFTKYSIHISKLPLFFQCSSSLHVHYFWCPFICSANACKNLPEILCTECTIAIFLPFSI